MSNNRIDWKTNREIKKLVKIEETQKFNITKKNVGWGINILSVLFAIVLGTLPIVEANITSNEVFRSVAIFAIITSLAVGILLIYMDFKNQEVNGYLDKIEQNSIDFINTSLQLKNYQDHERVQRFLSRFVHFEKNVISIQSYNYSISTLKDDYIIRVQYDSGYVGPDNDLNAIIQGIYTFNKEKFKKLNDAVAIVYHARNFEYLINFVTNIKKEDVEENYENYVLFTLGMEYLVDMLGGKESDYYEEEEINQIHAANGRKRLGVAKAILRSEILKRSISYSFEYLGDNSSIKGKRRYYTEIMYTNEGEKKIFLIAYETDQLENISLIENEIATSFRNLMINNDMVLPTKN